MSSRYLSPRISFQMNNRRLFEYPKEAEDKIILLIKQENSGLSGKELKEALEETKNCVSYLTGLFPLKDSSKENVNKLVEKLVDKSKISPTDKQKDKLRILIYDLLCKELAFGEEIDSRSKQVALKAVKILFPAQKGPLVIEQIKARGEQKQKIEYFFKDIIGDYKKDPLTLNRKESLKRFKALRDKICDLEKELDFFLRFPAHPDTLLLASFGIRLNTIDKLIYKCKLAVFTIAGYSVYGKSHDRLTLSASKLIDAPGRKGIRNPGFFSTSLKLADIWKKYTKKEPKRVNYNYESTRSAFGNFLEASIKSVIPIENSGKSRISLSNIVKDVISFRKKSMAKTSSK